MFLPVRGCVWATGVVVDLGSPNGGKNLKRDNDGENEDAQATLVGRHLDVQIRECEQPHKRRNRLRRPCKRHMPGLHRLHADGERVRQGARHQQRRCGPSSRWRAARKVNRVRDQGEDVEEEGEDEHS